MHILVRVVVALFVGLLPALAQAQCMGEPGFCSPGTGTGGGGAPTYTATGPSSGVTLVASTNFTVTIGTSSFSGTETFTIADGSNGGTFTPSIGSPGTSTVTVTPPSGTSFTFTYTPASTGVKTLTFTNGQQWADPAPRNYTSTSAGYTGPGDIVSGATFFYGLRAYNGAIASSNGKIVRLARTDTHQCDFLAATGGGIGVAANCSTGGDAGSSLATWCAATTCTVGVVYDQTGNGHDATATTGGALTLSLNCLNTTLPCINPGSGNGIESTVAISVSQPMTWSHVAQQTSGAIGTDIGCTGGSNVQMGFSSGNALNFAGNLATATATANTLHAMQNVVNGASSSTNVDGALTSSLNAGANVCTAVQTSFASAGNSLNGFVAEASLYASGLTTTQQNNLCHNQRLYWGSAGSC